MIRKLLLLLMLGMSYTASAQLLTTQQQIDARLKISDFYSYTASQPNSTTINGKLASLSATVASLSLTSLTHTAQISSLSVNLGSLSLVVVSTSATVASLSAISITLTSGLTSMSAVNTQQTTDINSITAINAAQDTKISSLSGSVTANTTNIASISTTATNNTTAIAALTANSRRQVIDLGSRSTSYTLNIANYDDTDLYVTATGSFTVTVSGAAQGKKIYMRVQQGGSGSYTVAVLPTPAHGATVSWNTAVGKVNTFGYVCYSSSVIEGNSTKYP